MATVLHVCPRFAPARGGAEEYFGRLARAQVEAGHAVEVWATDSLTVRGFTSAGEPRAASLSETLDAGVRVHRYPVRHIPAQRWVRTIAHLLPGPAAWRANTVRWTPWVPQLTRAARAVSPGSVDVVHAGVLPYTSVLQAAADCADRADARLIVTPFTHVAPPGARGRAIRRAYLSRLNVGILERADAVLVQTEYERRVLEDAGIDGRRLRLIGLGVDAGPVSGGDADRGRRRWQVPEGLVVGHLANKSWDKGTVDLLNAAQLLWSRGAAFTLLLAGARMPSFDRCWKTTRFRDRIRDLPVLSDEERRDFYAAIDVFALPSYVESFGLSALEATSAGAAVLAYDHGGPGSLFRDGVSARLVAVGNLAALRGGLAELLGRPDLRAHLVEGGRRLVATLPWDRALARMAGVFDEVLAR